MTFTKENFKFSEAANAFHTDTPSKTIRCAPQPNVSNYFHGIWNLKKKLYKIGRRKSFPPPIYILLRITTKSRSLLAGIINVSTLQLDHGASDTLTLPFCWLMFENSKNKTHGNMKGLKENGNRSFKFKMRQRQVLQWVKLVSVNAKSIYRLSMFHSNFFNKVQQLTLSYKCTLKLKSLCHVFTLRCYWWRDDVYEIINIWNSYTWTAEWRNKM